MIAPRKTVRPPRMFPSIVATPSASLAMPTRSTCMLMVLNA